MNLTKLCVAGLCLSAMTASATIIATNSFETGAFVGDFIAPEGAITAGETGLTDADTPMVGVGDTKVLKLDTEGGVWTNTVNASFAGTTNVYADMLVKFVPSEELPIIGTDVKVAVAVLAGTPNKLAINAIDQVYGVTNAWIVTEGAIDTNVWCRLTVNIYSVPNGDAYAVIKTNGVAVNDPYFVNQSDKTLNAIGFQGTGYIDEVVVRDEVTASTAVLLTLNFTTGSDIASVLVGGVPQASGSTVTNGSALVITAAQWKEILNVTGPSTVTWDAGAPSNSTATVTVSNETATNVYITAQTETSTTPIGGSTYFSGEESNKVATWALDNDVTTLSNDMYDQYLLNLAEDATLPDLLITSISVSGTTVTVTVEATGVDFETINGTLMIKAYETLGGAETVYTAPVTGYSPVTIVKDIGSNKFVKIAVE